MTRRSFIVTIDAPDDVPPGETLEMVRRALGGELCIEDEFFTSVGDDVRVTALEMEELPENGK